MFSLSGRLEVVYSLVDPKTFMRKANLQLVRNVVLNLVLI